MKVHIKKINSIQTFELRHPLLRKGQPLSSCSLDLDDDPQSFHLGAYQNKKLVGILSAMPTPCPDQKAQNGIQFRAIAVHPDHQRTGIATQLIQKAFLILDEGIRPHHIWLNARIAANTLYIANGFTPTGFPFDIHPIGTHQRFIKHMSYES